MPAVVRVKRRIDEEPHSAFVLNGKKRRVDNGSSIELSTNENAEQTRNKDELSTVLKFAGTIKEQDNTVTTQIATRLKKSDARELVQQKTTSRRQQQQQQNLSHTERARKELRQAQQEQRFRVVNCQRTTLGDLTEADANNAPTQQQTNINDGAASASSSAAEITIVDIEPHMEIEATTVPAQSLTYDGPADSDTGYVYDLYLPEDEQQAAYVDMMDDNYLSVRCCEDLHFEDCYNNDSEYENDSEDSNQENYFANDYPDEEDDMQMNGPVNVNGSDEELCNAMRGFLLDNDDDDDDKYDYAVTSSEDDDNDNFFIHSVSVDEPGFVNDIDYFESRFGTAYARYRRRVLKSLDNNKDDNTSDDDTDANDEIKNQ